MLKGGLVAAFLATASAVAAQTSPLVVSDGGVSGITARTAYTVDSVIVLAVDAATTNGVTVGMTWSEVYASRPPPRCTRGMEQETGMAFCSLPGFTNVRLVFRTNTDDLPPAEVPSHSRVESIVWRAGS